ncbi:MAG: carbohydrate-binding family 9-like protein [Armatimonadetes bacterium]|nr:carbohydrate-binding family 9-like protein [Armatimonadota bacterium]
MTSPPPDFITLPFTGDWDDVPAITQFFVLASDAEPSFETDVRLAWSEEGLHFNARLTDPCVTAKIEEDGGPIWQDPAFELFLDPGCMGVEYFEWEINANGAVWGLQMDKPYVAGGSPIRTLNDLVPEYEVWVEGILGEETEFWQVEGVVPWRNIGGKPGSLRANFCRVHHPAAGEIEWQSSAPIPVVDYHRPYAWGRVHLVSDVSEVPNGYPEWESDLAMAEACGMTRNSRSEGLVVPLDAEVTADGWVLKRGNLSLNQDGRWDVLNFSS